VRAHPASPSVRRCPPFRRVVVTDESLSASPHQDPYTLFSRTSVSFRCGFSQGPPNEVSGVGDPNAAICKLTFHERLFLSSPSAETGRVLWPRAGHFSSGFFLRFFLFSVFSEERACFRRWRGHFQSISTVFEISLVSRPSRGNEGVV